MKRRITIIVLAVLLVAALLLGVASCTRGRADRPEETSEPTETTEASKAATDPTEEAEDTIPLVETEPKEIQTEETGETPPGGKGSGNNNHTGSAGTGSGGNGGSGIGSNTGNSGGTAAPTQPTSTNPTEHTHSYAVTSTVPATCISEGSSTYTCSCGDSYTEAIPLTAHNWVNHHEDEVKHQEFKCVCQCGAQFGSESEWIAHVHSYDNLEALTNHGHWGSVPFWIVDVPARDWDECSVCGATK